MMIAQINDRALCIPDPVDDLQDSNLLFATANCKQQTNIIRRPNTAFISSHISDYRQQKSLISLIASEFRNADGERDDINARFTRVAGMMNESIIAGCGQHVEYISTLQKRLFLPLYDPGLLDTGIKAPTHYTTRNFKDFPEKML